MSAVDVDGGGNGPVPPLPSQYVPPKEKKLRRQAKAAVMTHKYKGSIAVLLINKSVEPNKEHKVLISGFDQGFTVNTSKQVFRSI
jgi:hypothetical protein